MLCTYEARTDEVANELASLTVRHHRLPTRPSKCWKRLVRFVAQEDGKEYYGEPVHALSVDIGELFQSAPGKLKAKVLNGDPLSSSCTFAKPEKTLTVKKLLPPVDVPRYGASIRCLGTNYPIGGAKKPSLPILFYKPYTCLAGFGDPIVIPREVQNESDYEVELVIVIGQAGHNIPIERALDHVVGYTICNDVSARKRMFATPQWGMGKSYDGWLPIGPCLVAKDALPKAAQDLQLKTVIDSRKELNPLQDGPATYMLWQIAETVSALSYGTTLRVGDIICTGTPDGQGSNRKPPVWLRHGDNVTVSIEGIGSLVNPVRFESSGRESKL